MTSNYFVVIRGRIEPVTRTLFNLLLKEGLYANTFEGEHFVYLTSVYRDGVLTKGV